MISVISPVKDAASFLETCLNSIINQSCQNWELLLVNDNSTDNTFDILNHYAQKDSRIKVFQNKGNGIINALKTGYSQSVGKYITRMDADDIMPIEKLEIMRTELLESNNKGVATGYVTYFSDGELGEGFQKYEQWLNSLVDNNSHFNEIYKECVIASPCWMIAREVFEECGGFNSEIYPEDYDLVFRFYKHQLTVLPIKQKLHIWRDHPKRVSRNSEHYADNSFIDIKMNYFLELDYNSNLPLMLWGAGKKGKSIAKILIKNNINFVWACDNPKKIGKHIYDIPMVDVEKAFRKNVNYQSIISVANPKAQEVIRAYLTKKNNVQPFMFC